MNYHNINILIAKVLSDNASNSDHKKLDQWISASKENYKTFYSIKRAWTETNTKIDLGDQKLEEAYDKIKRNIVVGETKEKYPNHVKKIDWVYKIAASILLFVVAGFFIFQFVYKVPHASPEIVPANIIAKTVNKGQKLKIHLPDGSKVWLNSESKILYPDRFDDSLRKVTLYGEAFFEVKESTDKPFIVHTGNIKTRVLGTSFNISNTEEDIEVALVSGKVQVYANNHSQEYTLTPGEALHYMSDSRQFRHSNFNYKKVAGWKDGILYFEEAGFSEVIAALEKWYGVEIYVENFNQIPWKYSGEFQNEYLDIVLESISYSKNFEFTIDQNKVNIKFN